MKETETSTCRSGFMGNDNKDFAIGTYLWIYDLEEDNTFRRPGALKHLKRL